jgi:hypothetical protein
MLDKQVENVGNLSIFWLQGRIHCLQLANPKKKYLKAGEICGFSQNLPLGS